MTYEVRLFGKRWRSEILSVCRSLAEAEAKEIEWSKIYRGEKVKIVPRSEKKKKVTINDTKARP